MSALLEIRNLSILFKNEAGYTTALNDVSFDIEKSKVCGIVGESGSGKSITSLAIMGLLSSNSKFNGEIIYNGTQAINLLALDESERQKYRGSKFAMIFQEPMTSLNPVMKCGKQVMESIILHKNVSSKEAYERCIKLFEEVKLPNPDKMMEAYPHEISGGQKQRVMIAMALSSDPELLIADEPTTALDVTVQKNIIDLLKSIKNDRAMSMIFISHDLALVSDISDQVIVMNKGKIKEISTSKEIFEHPKHPYTKGLLACRPSISVDLKRLPVVSDFLSKDQAETDAMMEAYKWNVTERAERTQSIEHNDVLIEVKNLYKSYPTKKDFFGKTIETFNVLKNINLKIKKSETLGLVGESGCGKTSLGRSILRLIEPDAGEVLFEGQNILGLSKSELRELRPNLQIVFQDPYSSLNPRMSIGQTLMEPMSTHHILKNDRQRKEHVKDILQKVGLSAEHFNRFPHQFSGGQRQRICIARALVLNPKFIVCDESVSALDVSVQAQVLNLLSDLREEFNLTYLFISHDLSVIKHISDRIIVMKKGEIIEENTPENIFFAAKNEYTKKLIESIP